MLLSSALIFMNIIISVFSYAKQAGRGFAIFLMLFPVPFPTPDTLVADQDFQTFSGSGYQGETLSLYAEFIPETVSVGQELSLKLLGRLNQGYYIYSVDTQGEFAPVPTSFILSSDLFIARSQIMESGTITVYDEAFDQELSIHRNDFRLERRFQLADHAEPGSYQVEGVLFYQVCDNRICSLPLEKEFSARINIKQS